MASGRSGASKLYQSPLERQILIKEVSRRIKERVETNVTQMIDEFNRERLFLRDEQLVLTIESAFKISELRDYLEELVP